MAFLHFIRSQRGRKEPIRKLEFQDRYDILLKIRFSGAAEQGYTFVIWESRLFMNNKQWIKDTIAHPVTGPVPWNMMFSPPAMEAVQKYYGVENIHEFLGFPIRDNGPVSIKPLYASPSQYGETITDEFGVVWSTSNIDRGSPIGPSVKEANLSNYRWPDPKQEYRFEGLSDWAAANAEHFTMLWVGDLWERASFMRGMEEILLDVALHPNFVSDLLEGIKDYIIETMQILFERFEFDAIAVSDDYGTQNSMMMSPDSWRRLIKPKLKEIYELAKDNGRYVFHHSCGQFYPIIPDLIEIGLNILHPIQPEAMDIYKLKRKFGKDLTFCGGLNTQQLLPEATPQEVRNEVKQLKEKMGVGGGYILEPGITIQADVPLENILALIDECSKR